MKLFMLQIKKSLQFILLCILSLSINMIMSTTGNSQAMFMNNSGEIDHTYISADELFMRQFADGRSGSQIKLKTNYYEKIETGNIISHDGIIWGGIVNDGATPKIRTGGQLYDAGTQPGSIIAKGIAEDASDPDVNRIWRIPGYLFSNWRIGDELAIIQNKPSSEVSYDDIEEIQAVYEKDLREWPEKKGAPYYENFYAGLLPGIADADQVSWMVYNDLDEQKTQALTGSPPIGLEIQVTTWTYNDYNYRNTIFKQIRIVYKGTKDTPDTAKIDSMYIGIWANPDIGMYDDDLVGCDAKTNIGYAYNSSTIDAEYDKYGRTPAAVGYDILAGPIVPAAGSEAFFKSDKVSDYKNLSMSSFSSINENDIMSDSSNYDVTLKLWNILRGKSRIDPVTGAASNFHYSGDPVTHQGWIDNTPGDKMIVLAAGPFSMKLGETNEITLTLASHIGADRLASISAMKYFDRNTQEYFNNLFKVMELPLKPILSATEYDSKILLSWYPSQEEVNQLEQWESMGHKFEGYNVYQLDIPANWWRANKEKIVTFDVKNEVTTITQESFDWRSNAVLPLAIQTGTNSGIRRSLLVNRDILNKQPPANGKEYHFALTAYSYNPDPEAAIKSLESDFSYITVIPQHLSPGITLQADFGDTIIADHTNGNSDGQVLAIVIDPLKLSGDQYKVTFNEGGNSWNLYNVIENNDIATNITNQSGDKDYPITDGVLVVVKNNEAGNFNTGEDEFSFQTQAPVYSKNQAITDIQRNVNVFPNPYYYSINKSADYNLTFSHLPKKAIIRIFTIAGVLVRVIEKDDTTTFAKWNLLNHDNRLVVSGIYIAYIEMPDLGINKILKLAIVQE